MAVLKQSNKSVRIREISWNLDRPRYAYFSVYTDYDTTSPSLLPNDPIKLVVSGKTVFNGWVLNMRRKIEENGNEELVYEAAGPRAFLHGETFEKDGSVEAVYNVEDNILTCGQIFAEVASTIQNKYVAYFNTSEALAMTTLAGKFEIRNQSYAEILQELIEKAGSFAWFVDAEKR